MKTLTTPVLATFIFTSLFFVSSAAAGTFGEIDTSTFLGWSADGKLIAQKRSLGRFDMDNPGKDWILEYIRVQSVKSKKTVAVFKVTAQNVPTLKDKSPLRKQWLADNRQEIKTFEKAQSASMWPNYQAIKMFSKQEGASAVSPSSAWEINMKIKDMPTGLKSKIEKATGEDEEEAGDFSCGGQFAGVMYKYNAFNASNGGDGSWVLSVLASNTQKDVHLGRTTLMSINGDPKGRFVGCLGAYWGPREKSVAVEWIWRPIVDGVSKSEVIFSSLE